LPAHERSYTLAGVDRPTRRLPAARDAGNQSGFEFLDGGFRDDGIVTMAITFTRLLAGEQVEALR
jgi:hypothetical protein